MDSIKIIQLLKQRIVEEKQAYKTAKTSSKAQTHFDRLEALKDLTLDIASAFVEDADEILKDE